MDTKQMMSEIFELVRRGEILNCVVFDPYSGDLCFLSNFRVELLRDVSFRYSAFPSGDEGEIPYLHQCGDDFIMRVYNAVKARKRNKNLF